MSDPRLLVADTASMYFRAFHGVPTSLRAPDGRPVNAVRGLLDFLARFIVEYRPDQLVCCWDESWRPTWRVDLVPSYKAHRVDHDEVELVPSELTAQVPLIRAVLAALGFAVVGYPDHEADDVIATMVATHEHCDVITGDRDLFQVVDDQRDVRVLYLGRGVGKHEKVDAAWVQGRYGVSPTQYVDFAVLRGDPSDGLPGVAGIGEKTAAALLGSYSDLNGILAAVDAGKVAPRIAAALAGSIDYLAAARQVVTVVPDLPLSPTALALPAEPADPQRFAQLSEELGLGGSSTRILEALATTAQERRT